MTAALAAHYLPVSWVEFQRDARALAWRLMEVGAWQSIVAVACGGLVPAAIVAKEMGIRVVDTVCIASYENEAQGELQILKPLHGTGEGVLVIDDLVDTGDTALIIRNMLPKAHIATVYAKPKGRPKVDTFVTEVSQNTWIEFPWENGGGAREP